MSTPPSLLRAALLLNGQDVPVTDTALVFDDGWAPYAAAVLTVPYTPERAEALDPRNRVRLLVSVERVWTGSLTLDDLSDRWYTPPGPPVPVVVHRTNLSTNPSFEVNLAGWAANNMVSAVRSTAWAAPGARAASVRTQGPASGGSSTAGDVRLTPGGATVFPTNIQAGHTYTVSAVQYTPTAHVGFSTAAASRQRRVMLFYSTNGSTFTEDKGPQGANIAGVQRISHTFTVPANATGCMVAIGCAASSTDPSFVTFVDALLIEEGTTLGAYFDGSTPDTSTADYAWTGPADLSTSTEAVTSYVPGDPGTTLDDLSAAWAGLTLDDLTRQWGVDWGSGYRPSSVVTADLIVRQRDIDHAAATITVRAGSDELLAQDARAEVSRPLEALPERLTQLLAAGHVPVGPPPDFTAGAGLSVPAQVVEWSSTIWDAMQANANACGLHLYCDEARVWRLREPLSQTPASGSVDVQRPSTATDTVNSDGEYADVFVWVGTGVSDAGVALREIATYPTPVPAGPYRAHLEEHDYGQVETALPMPAPAELAARLALLQARDRVLTVTAVADPSARPGMGVDTGYPSLPLTTSTVARVEWAVPADTMTLTTRSTSGDA